MFIRKVRPGGQIWWKGSDLFLSEVLAGEPVALEQTDDRYYRIYFGPIPVAKLDEHKRKIIKPKCKKRKRRCTKKTKVLPMS
jgi:hypothetical protein